MRFLKIFLITLSILGILVGAVYASLPYFFDRIIKIEVKEMLATTFKNKVRYDAINVSSVNDLPYFKISFANFIIDDTTGLKKDTLFYSSKLSFSISLKKWLFEHKYIVEKVRLDNPNVKLKKYKNGADNFEYFFISDSSATNSKSDTSKYYFKISSFQIKNGSISFIDLKGKNNISSEKLNFDGALEITDKRNIIKAKLSTENFTFKQKNIYYLLKNNISAELNFDYNSENQRITFNDHYFSIDDFKFGFHGFIENIPNGVELDIIFKTEESKLKNILSLVPGIYKKELKDMDVKGDFRFEGEVKGIFNPRRKILPAYQINFVMENGYLKYNHLPQPIDSLNLDLKLEKQQGFAEPVFKINKFTARLDSNKIAGILTISGRKNYFINGIVNANLELHELNQYLKLDSFQLNGDMIASTTINGIYNQEEGLFPKISSYISLKNGYFKKKNIEYALEKIQLETQIENNTGKISSTSLKINKLNFVVDEEPFDLYGRLDDLSEYKFDLTLKTSMDLEKISKIISLEDYELSGLISTKLKAKGSLKEIKKADIDGIAAFSNIKLTDKHSGNIYQIQKGNMVMSPTMLMLPKLEIMYNKQAFTASLNLKNYHDFLLDSTKILIGNLRIQTDSLLYSNLVADKILVDSSHVHNSKNDKQILISKLLERYNFTIKFNANKIKYDNYSFHKLSTSFTASKEGIELEKMAFNTIDSRVLIKNTLINDKNFELDIDVKDLQTQKVMGLMSKDTTQNKEDASSATVSIKYSLKGNFEKALTPDLKSIIGKGKISVDKANVKGMKLLSSIGQVTEHESFHHDEVHDAVIETDVKEGKITVKPSSLKIGKYLVNIEGTHTFENEINYYIKLGVPPLHKIKIPVHVSGTVDKPEIKISGKREDLKSKTEKEAQ
jgi:hypothetical protein